MTDIDIARCGRISYTNDLPVYAGIDDDVLLFPGSMLAGVPAQLNAALLEGRLDISPISSAFYATHAEELVLLPGVCIGAAGAVHSVCCVANGELASLAGRTIASTKESATGRLLLRLICRRYHGFDAKLLDDDDPFAAYLRDGTPCLLIGDGAIDATEQAPIGAVWDLGRLWRELAGSGMVYAVWATRRSYALAHPERVQAVADALRASLAWGLEHRGAVVARAQATRPRADGFYETYYDTLRFDFDDEARAALATFLGAAHEAGLIDRAPALSFFGQTVQHV